VAAADRPLRVLLEEVAAGTPAPGGGCSAAWTGALAAALVEMAAAFAQGAGALGRRAAELRLRLLELGEAELHAYEPVLQALREDRDRLGQALSDAASSPLEIARAAADVAELAVGVARSGSPHLEGDAVTGALLAQAACRAAARLVEINLAQAPGDPRREEVTRLVERATAAIR
jgi:formiminotetrahydrofolate cyclodeaminase